MYNHGIPVIVEQDPTIGRLLGTVAAGQILHHLSLQLCGGRLLEPQDVGQEVDQQPAVLRALVEALGDVHAEGLAVLGVGDVVALEAVADVRGADEIRQAVFESEATPQFAPTAVVFKKKKTPNTFTM